MMIEIWRAVALTLLAGGCAAGRFASPAFAHDPSPLAVASATTAPGQAIKLIHKKTRPIRRPDQAEVLLELNDGSIDELARLPGIDAELAYAIVRRRPYASLHALVDKHVFSEVEYDAFVNRFPLID